MIRLLTAFLFLLCALRAGAVELLARPTVVLAETSATLSWRTDVACGTRVSYGTAPDKLDQKAEGPVIDQHEVVLTGLTKGTTYYYSFGSARQKLGSGNFIFGAASTATPVPQKSMLERMRDALTPAPSATKPASSVPARAPPTRATWGNVSSLQDHFDRHGADFQSRSPDDYAAQAWQFLQRAKAGEVPMKWDDADSSLRVFDPRTRAFAAYNRDGTTKTYFRPNDASYWQRQPGRLIQPSQLPFK
ncbi:MAG: fibronectin type III domain-containing protein [Prosthecobacter sp.]